jgi:hypothetical protein
MYGAAKAHGDRLDRPPGLKNYGFNEVVRSDIDLGRGRMLVDRRQFFVLRLGSPLWSSGR